jgi:hypothetical protein
MKIEVSGEMQEIKKTNNVEIMMLRVARWRENAAMGRLG